MTTAETLSPLILIQRATIKGPGWMNARQAAFYTRCCVATILRACRAGELRHIRIGHRRGPIWTRSEWVDAWMFRGVQEPVIK